MKKTLSISNRGLHAPASPIRSLVPFATAAIKKGIHVYHLNIGDPDFSIPDTIQKELQEVAKHTKRIPYPAFRGQQVLLDAWKAYFKDISLPVAINDEDMIVTAGASDAIVLAASVATDPGDDILMFEPYYAPYITYGHFLSIRVNAVTLQAKNNFHLPPKEAIVKKITPKTKAIFFINPNNPTGTVFTRQELETVLEIAREYNLFIVSDETYRGMVFDNAESLSFLHVAKKEDLDRIIIVDSLSKRLNVCGARMGLLMSKNKAFVEASFRFTQARPYAAYIEQEIVAPMLSSCMDYVHWLTGKYQKRRDAFIQSFEKASGIKVHTPEGAFYTMLPLPIDDATHFAKWLLTDFSDKGETVMVTPAEGFYATKGLGRNEVRVAYILEEKKLVKAAQLLAKAITQYPNKKR
jgi:aspartate aminotransferase